MRFRVSLSHAMPAVMQRWNATMSTSAAAIAAAAKRATAAAHATTAANDNATRSCRYSRSAARRERCSHRCKHANADGGVGAAS